MTADIAHSINAGGIVTNFHDQGSGDPVLLIHGSGPGVSAWSNWRTVIPELSKQHRVIAPDLYGFGYTELPKGAIRDKTVWVQHVVDLADALGIGQFSVVGNSFGGAVAIALMREHPERVKRAVLMGAVGLEFPITEALDYVWGYSPTLENLRTALSYLATDPSRLTDDLIRIRYEASVRKGVHQAYSSTFGPSPRQNQIAMLASIEAEIRSIQQEVLILHGKLDQVIPMQVSLRPVSYTHLTLPTKA